MKILEDYLEVADPRYEDRELQQNDNDVLIKDVKSQGKSEQANERITNEFKRGRKRRRKASMKEELNSDWLKNFVDNFKERIIDPLSYRTRCAIKVNEDIKEKEDKAKVRAEILKKLLEEMVNEEIIMGIHSVRRIVEKLGHLYPAMFFESKSDRGYGLGGGQGNVQLPRHLMDRYHKKLNLMGR